MNTPETSLESIFLENYQVPAYWVDTTNLDISIEVDYARVRAQIAVRKNPQGEGCALVLDGEELVLESVAIDGSLLTPAQYSHTNNQLRIENVPESFVLETVVRIEPDKNTQLCGLYRSQDGYFTQCEAQGFRRITFYPDRPDVMSRFTCTLHADKAQFPVLLSNGNPIEQGEQEGGRHWAKWEDPFPKPAYLFACVAAKLEVLEDFFVTRSGRRVRCAVYVEPGKLDQCAHAMSALKKSMKWDEEVFGLEMDLDHYMIVAVGDFNMGAMENKGLNIFNTKYVLARPDVATDADYQNIDRVVAHEYFHNWTGNRVTCRDWFQLSLKEGLTVFRDQQFGMDVHSAGVTRIQEVRNLRAAQFPEDAGPMAHPIRPATYSEINNFYTATVYEKGAEVVRMIHTLIGKEAFRCGMDLYFERHDGQAVTCEDFVAAMQEASGVDLTQFKRWYNQAGTPELYVTSDYDAQNQRYTLNVEQRYPSTAYERRMKLLNGKEPERAAYHIPLVVALLGKSGEELPLHFGGQWLDQPCVLSVTEDKQSFVFENVTEAPIPSLLRGFSAPVVLHYEYTDQALSHLMAFDADPVNRWEAGQRLATRVLMAGVAAFVHGEKSEAEHWVPAEFISAFSRTLSSAFVSDADKAFVAEALTLPSETYLAGQMTVVDPDAIFSARLALRRYIAAQLHDVLVEAYGRLQINLPYSPDAQQAGERALRNVVLAYLAENQTSRVGEQLALAQFESAGNMTDSVAALWVLAQNDSAASRLALSAFYAKWKHEALVVDKWLTVQACSRLPDTGEVVRTLMAHESFDIRNPNKVYALVRAFCAANPKHFHAVDGSGYKLAADVILQLDPINPQVASRIARTFDRWRKFDLVRQSNARAQLERIDAHKGLSSDVREVLTQALSEN